MFGRNVRQAVEKRSRRYGRRLGIEGLETRAVLTGDVAVTLAAGVLTLTGDASANEVEITAGASVGQYILTGLNNTQLNGVSNITDPFDRIVVDLKGGSDTFTVRGASAANKIIIAGDIDIDNGDGHDTNRLINVQLNDDLTIKKTAGTSESDLEIGGSLIVGDVTWDATTFDGDSKTVIKDNTQIQGNLSVTNNVGDDHFVCYASTIDGDATISNGDGDTRTTFGITEDPTVWGKLTITNGVGNDKVFIHDTDVWQNVSVSNGDGHTLVSVQTSDIGLGAPVGTTGDLAVSNGSGIDELTMTTVTVRDDLTVNNGGAEAFGSRTAMTGVSIGRNIFWDGDAGRDTATISTTRVVNTTDFDPNAGSSAFDFINDTFLGNFDMDATTGNDDVVMNHTTVEGDVTIDLGAGRDLVSLIKGTKWLGSTSLEGGSEIDEFRRQVAPAVDAIVIAFLATETFELETFVLQ